MSTTTTLTETTFRKLPPSSGSVSSMAVPRDVAGLTDHIPGSSGSNSIAGPSTSSTISTLRLLYPRAAHSLLQRDFSLTHALLGSAFELLTPPDGPTSIPDALDTHRRKWEILRITLETSAYASPPASKHVGADDVLPAALRANLMLSAPGLITALHARSVRLFTPKSQNPKAAFLPAQILVPLVLSSVKLECPEVGRSMIEDWLAQRDPANGRQTSKEGYEHILELYCLHVLPGLHEWEYAQEFLEYERELPEHVRQHFKSALQGLRTQEIEAARTIPSPPPMPDPLSSSSSSRTPSPSRSVGSNSSSDTDDTHSTRTVVPHTPRPHHGMNGLTPLAPSSSTSRTSLPDSTRANGHAAPGKRAASPASTAQGVPPRSGRSSALGARPRQGTVGARDLPSTTALITSAVRAYLEQLGSSRLVFALLCILLPVLSFLVRSRRRRRQTGGSSTSSADAVRHRLTIQSKSGVLGTVWSEIVRAVTDAVRMAGSGLV